MKILHINTTDRSGGAAIAALRLHTAMLESGIDSAYFVLHRSLYGRKDIVSVSPVDKYFIHPLNALLEKRAVSVMRKVKSSFSVFNYGIDITKYKAVQTADVIYIHWINTSFISRGGLEKLLRSGKKVFWFMHDMFPITGGCHYALDCGNYRKDCRNCFFYSGKNIFSAKAARQLKLKQTLYKKYANLAFIAPSRWLYECTKQSAAAKYNQVYHIPNLIDDCVYKPIDSLFAKRVFGIDTEKKTIGIGAVNIAENPYKGWEYFMSALGLLASEHLELAGQVQILVFGGFYDKEIAAAMPFKTYFLGALNDDYSLALVYNCLDVFVIPSIAENFPQTVLESLACNVPVAGFNTGGIPDMVNDNTGYLAEYKSSGDLAWGIFSILKEGRLNVKDSIKPFVKDVILARHTELI